MKVHPYANPFGNIQFQYESDSLYSSNNENGELYRLISGQQLHLIRKEENLINYYHFSPGTDTRVASIDLKQLGFCNKLLIAFWWSPEEIIFILHNSDTKKSVEAHGIMSNRKLRIGTDGDIYQVGDTDVSVSQISIYTNGNYIIQNTALNTWNETLESVKIMLSFINEDYSKEMVLVNISLVMLVTGLEAYTKKRFIETYFEGPHSMTKCDKNLFRCFES